MLCPLFVKQHLLVLQPGIIVAIYGELGMEFTGTLVLLGQLVRVS